MKGRAVYVCLWERLLCVQLVSPGSPQSSRLLHSSLCSSFASQQFGKKNLKKRRKKLSKPENDDFYHWCTKYSLWKLAHIPCGALWGMAKPHVCSRLGSEIKACQGNRAMVEVWVLGEMEWIKDEFKPNQACWAYPPSTAEWLELPDKDARHHKEKKKRKKAEPVGLHRFPPPPPTVLMISKSATSISTLT